MTYPTDKIFLGLVQAGLAEDALREHRIEDPPMDSKHLAEATELLAFYFLEDFAEMYVLQLKALK